LSLLTPVIPTTRIMSDLVSQLTGDNSDLVADDFEILVRYKGQELPSRIAGVQVLGTYQQSTRNAVLNIKLGE
jgi:hypothetical protein